MFYIHRSNCVSPQLTIADVDLDNLNGPVDNKMMAVEPSYESIPPGILRRMGRSVKLGLGAALPLIDSSDGIDGIVIGTTGGMGDCKDFLDQIIEYDEGALTPTKFVQSSLNAVASQLAFMTKNKGYNITHVHKGLSFENAVLDVDMLLKEDPNKCYLVGGVDEISAYSYNIDVLGGWFKKENISIEQFYTTRSSGSLAGEGAAMFVVDGKSEGASATFKAISIFQTSDEDNVSERLRSFISENDLEKESIDLFLTGENGDERFLKFYNSCETVLENKCMIARYKHMTGENPTASALSLWIACHILKTQHLPAHMLKGKSNDKDIKNVLIYNSYHGFQHSFMLVSKM